jgi:excisionase family DNA binding protein
VTDRLLNAREVADRLGVAESWVREHTRAGNIPHLELGRWVRYEWPAVAAWLETCKRPGRPVTFRKAA